MAGHQEAFNLDITNVEDLTVLQEHLSVIDGHHGQLIQVIAHLPPHFPRQIPVFHLANVQGGMVKQPRAVCLHSTHVIRILVGDEDILNILRANAQPAHFLLQAVVVVACINHDGGISLAVEIDVSNPFPDTGHVLINPSCIQRVEDSLAPIHSAHGLALEFRRFL